MLDKLPALLMALSVWACSADTEPALYVEVPDVAGLYELVSFNGHPVPFEENCPTKEAAPEGAARGLSAKRFC